MAKENGGAKFGIGLALGAAIGAVAAFFFSPKSGKENRDLVKKKMRELEKFIYDAEIDERVKKVYGDVSDQSKKAYKMLKKETQDRVDELNDALENIDVEKYSKSVTKIVDKLQKEGGAKDMIEKAQKYLMSFIENTKPESKPEKKEAKK
jgi:gas vesicle protein